MSRAKQFFSSFFKSKNLLVFVSLFLACFFIFLLASPHIALADERDPTKIAPRALNYSADSVREDTSRGLFESFMVVLGQLIVNGGYQIAAICMIILTHVMSYLNVAITKDPRFIPAWASMRDIANMFIVLGFVIVGIATTLRIREYEAKKILPRLIIIAVLVNFSGLFCGLIIDASNIITNGLGGGSSGFMPYNLLFKLSDASSNYLNSQLTTESSKFLGSCVLFAIVYLGVAFTFIYLAFILLARYAILILLFILSPLAFALWIFPASRFKQYQTEWWDNFLKWCLVGVFASLVLSLGTTIMTTQDALKNNSNADLSSLFIACTVVLLFLYVGFKMTAKSSGLASMAGKAVMGLAGGAAGFAMGAVAKGGMGTLKGLANKTGLSQGANTLKTKATQLGEKWGFVAPGAAAGMEAKRLEEPKKRLTKLDSTRLAAIAQQSAWGKKKSEDKAAATELLRERNDLGDIKDEKTRAAAVAHAASFPGVKRSDYEKSDYRMRGYNDKTVQEIAKKRKVSPAAAEQIARREQLEQNLPSMSANQRRKIDVNDLTDDLLTSGYFTANMARDFRTASKSRRKKLKTLAQPGSQLHLAAQDAFTSGNTAEFNKLNALMTEISRIPK